MVLLWIKMRLRKDADAQVPAPLPFDDLSTHVGHIAKAQDIVALFTSGLLHGTSTTA